MLTYIGQLQGDMSYERTCRLYPFRQAPLFALYSWLKQLDISLEPVLNFIFESKAIPPNNFPLLSKPLHILSLEQIH